MRERERVFVCAENDIFVRVRESVCVCVCVSVCAENERVGECESA